MAGAWGSGSRSGPQRTLPRGSAARRRPRRPARRLRRDRAYGTILGSFGQIGDLEVRLFAELLQEPVAERRVAAQGVASAPLPQIDLDQRPLDIGVDRPEIRESLQAYQRRRAVAGAAVMINQREE